MDWGDALARARGLGGRLPSSARLAEVLSAGDEAELGRRLAGVHQDFAAANGARSARDLERVVTRVAAGQLALLHRWLGSRAPALGLVMEDEERRSLRALLRASTAPAASQPPSLIPTPRLGESLLRELAGARSPLALVNELARQGHPWAEELRSAASGDPPDQFELELALDRAFTRRARREARSGGRAFVRHAQRLIDASNGLTVVALAGRGGAAPRASFLRGGRAFSAAAFDAALRAHDREAATQAVARSLGRGPLARAFGESELTDLERRVLGALIEASEYEFLLDPLSPVGLLRHALRLRALVVDVRRRAWELALTPAMEGAA